MFELFYGKKAEVPIIQGGMGYKVTTAPLAASVASCGGVGVISAVGLTSEELQDQINKAREMVTNQTGLIAVNIMYAVSDFYNLVKTALDTKIDVIIFGAGFSRDIFEMAREAQISVVPIVSSARFAKLAVKLGASAVIVESGEAGGHLGTDRLLKDIIPEVVEAVDGKIPVFAAGGVTCAEDIKKILAMGADGVQLGTRFILSEECEVHQDFKNKYLNASAEDITVIQSPVGLPGQALKSPLVEKLQAGEKINIDTCVNCLKRCSRSFCIMRALDAARNGDMENGLFFTGTSVSKFNDILPVKEIFDQLKTAFEDQVPSMKA